MLLWFARGWSAWAEAHPTRIGRPAQRHGGYRGQGGHCPDGQGGGLGFLGAQAFDALKRGECPKGDVLATAKVAAIQAVKATPGLIPMCHPILIEGVEVALPWMSRANRSA